MEIAATILGAFIAACALLLAWLFWGVVRMARRARAWQPQRRHARAPDPECSCGQAWTADDSTTVAGCPIHDPALRNRPGAG